METYTLEDLVWAIEADRGQFSLFFARCNYRKLRDEMMQQLRERCAIASMQLQREDESLYWKFKAFVAQENQTALMVYGFENVQNIIELLTATNNLREKFVSDFKFPVVFWVNDTTVGQFENLAMDFKSFGKSINLPIFAEAVQTNLEDTIALFFDRILEFGGSEFVSNQAILGNSYRSELDSTLADLQQFKTVLSPKIEGSLALISGREAYLNHKIQDAIASYQNTAQLWQNVKDISPLKEAVLLFHLGECDRTLAEEEEKKEQQQSYWTKAKEYFADCLSKLQQSQREDLTANFINELGEVFLNLQDWQSLKDLALKSVEVQKTNKNPVQLARAYGFLAQVALIEKNWQEAKLKVNLALETLESLPLTERKNRAVYLLLSAQIQEYCGEHENSVQKLEEGINIGVEGKPYYFLQLLKELRNLYFSKKHYLDAYKTKIEYQSIRQQYGLTAFVGAGRIKASKTQKLRVSGRQGDINRLLERISSSKNKLTIIYGQSGVGKSSLVEAGLVPTLRQQKRIENRDILLVNLRVYTNWQEDFKNLLMAELEKHNKAPCLSFKDSSLSAILEQLKLNSDNYFLTVLIFDQFEEFFFTIKDLGKQRQFFEFFRDCLNLRFLKIVLSLREDYLHLILQGTRNLDLSAISDDILDRYILYYIGNFSKRSAREVIDELTRYSRFRLEDELKTQLITDLATELDEIRPIELQIAGAQLQQDNIRSLSQYRQIGKELKEKLIREYLEDVVRDCGEENQEIARLVLSLLIDEKNNTRPLKTKQDIEIALEDFKTIDKYQKLTLVLEILVLSGLVIFVPEKPRDCYQLIHDYLVDVIVAYVSVYESLVMKIRDSANYILTDAQKKTKAKNLKSHKIWILGTAIIVTVGIFLVRWTGVLQIWEWAVLDQLFRLRPVESSEERILIVGIDEEDIQQIGAWPISDLVLAKLIEKLNTAQPRTIGLDIYRDLPVEPGHRRLQETMAQTPHFVAIEKLGDNFSGIAPPLSLPEEAIGFNNVVTDADGKLRRSVFYIHENDGKSRTSFALRLALLYLKQEGIKPQPAEINAKYLQLKKTPFPSLQANDGAYVRVDNQGYQVLVNFRHPDAFERVSLREVLNGAVSPDRIRDRIVIIGSTAESLGDTVYIPYSTDPLGSIYPNPVYGVELHANFVSYILSAALDRRPIIKTWNEFLEWLWVFGWSGLGATLGWYLYFKHPIQMSISISIALLSLVIIIYVMFLGGWWLPLIPPIIGFVLGVMIFPLITAGQLEKKELRYTVQLLLTVIKKQPIVGNMALQYLKQSENSKNQIIIETMLQKSKIDSF